MTGELDRVLERWVGRDEVISGKGFLTLLGGVLEDSTPYHDLDW